MFRKTNVVPEGRWDLGKKENWRQVFGNDKLLWLFPVFSSKGNGFEFPVLSDGDDVPQITRTYDIDDVESDDDL